GPTRTLEEVKAELVAALREWHRRLEPEDRGAALAFGFTAFSLLSDQPLPLARFRSLRIPVPEDDPSWWG
ncbi:MAG: hypothetical protein ACLF0P_00315, partial [Thermoanaerobaculia bacterium]